MLINIQGKCTQKTYDRHAFEFLRMLAWMEICGNVGHSIDFRVNYDGDGLAHLIFDFEDESTAESYKMIKERMFEDYRKQHKEPKVFNFD